MLSCYQNSISRLRLLGYALQKIKIDSKLSLAYLFLTKDELDKFDFQKGDTEGFVNYALSIKGIVLAAIFIEDEAQNIIKISLRSRGSFSVNLFARKYFNGGGHDNAAGGRSELALEETAARFERIVAENSKSITETYEV